MAVAMQTEDFPYLPSGPAEVNKMIKEHGDLFSDSQCNICSAVLISESQKLSHYQSKKHANKVRRYLSVQNEEPALKKFKSSSDASPYQANVHAKNPRLKPAGPQTPAASQTPPSAQPAEESSSVPTTGNNNSNDDNNNPDRFCSICQASFNNPLMAQQHYVGKKHRKRLAKLKLMETYSPSTAPASTLKGYPCTVCNIDLNSMEQYQSHISGAKHKNQVKKSRLNTAVNQEAAGQPQEGNDQSAAPVSQSAAPVSQSAAPVSQSAAPVSQSAAPVSQSAAPVSQSAAPVSQYAAPVSQYTAPVSQYAPEDTQYSEEYQFT